MSPIRSTLLLGTYLFVCSGKRFPFSANQLTDLCDSHAGHIARGNAILQEKAVCIKGLLDEAIVLDVLICFLGALGPCLCSELVSSVVGVSDLCRCVGFKPLFVGDFVLGLVLMGNVIGTLRRSVISRTKGFSNDQPYLTLLWRQGLVFRCAGFRIVRSRCTFDLIFCINNHVSSPRELLWRCS